jgi:hypothetical protein
MTLKLVVTTILIALLIGACGSSAEKTPEPTPDVAAVRTSAASTVVSQFTLTAAAFTPTPPPPTDMPLLEATATPTELPFAVVTNAEGTSIPLTDKYSWDPATVDVNVPDNTPMSPGQEFVKTWKIKNIGIGTWGEGYKMIYSYGDKMDGVAQPLTAAIAPGEEVEVSVAFTAPALPGSYQSFWTLQNPKGIAFQGNDGKVLYVLIVVQ